MNKKYRVFREIGRVAVNFGSLTFASLVLGTIIRGDYDRLLLLLIGGGISAVLIVWGREMNLIILLSIPAVIMTVIGIYALVSEKKDKKTTPSEILA